MKIGRTLPAKSIYLSITTRTRTMPRIEEYKEIICSAPNTNSRFKFIRTGKGVRFTVGDNDFHCLAFALDGKLKTGATGHASVILQAGQFTLVPARKPVTATSLQPGRYLLFLFNRVDQVWTSTKIRKLLESKQDIRLELPIRHPLDTFLNLIALYMTEEELDRSFYAWKDNELLSLLYAFYTPYELGSLFSPVLSENLDFRSFVEANYLKVENASELAELAGCSLVTLNRKFREHFNDTAYQWIIKNKMTLIKKRLQTTAVPLAELAKEFGFYSGSELNRFCQRQFGLSALKLRKSAQEKKQAKK